MTTRIAMRIIVSLIALCTSTLALAAALTLAAIARRVPGETFTQNTVVAIAVIGAALFAIFAYVAFRITWAALRDKDFPTFEEVDALFAKKGKKS